jgi:hypothetical protein
MDAHDIMPAVAGMISQHQHRRNKMTLPTNDDFANCELTMDELEAIAAGGFWSTLKHIGGDVLKGVGYVVVGAAYVGGAAAIAGGAYLFLAGALGGQRPVVTVNGNMQ